jgi:hypothetical protein
MRILQDQMNLNKFTSSCLLSHFKQGFIKQAVFFASFCCNCGHIDGVWEQHA